MKIMLACAMGMSTSLLVKKMQDAAKEQGKNYKIWATDIDSVEDEEEDYDIVMLGPQVSWRKAEVDEIVNGRVPVVVINKPDYGSCNGAAVLKAAEDVLA
ncbi:MAG: PTS sugar transporter subunit IIB [Lachnospiraceae bacterium]|jgi:PTS system cellobiose-specific IIB component|nr:PTS sugar transporter subunit IIB [Lachnospiraceae bacterium]